MKKWMPGLCFALFSIWVSGQPSILDLSFNSTGVKQTKIGQTYNRISTVLKQVDGKLLAVSNSNIGLNNNISLIRYMEDGNLDKSFGTEGVINSGPLGGYSSVYSLAAALQADGRVVVAGNVKDGYTYHTIIIRFKPNGQLDSSFNATGFRIIKMAATSYPNAIGIQADGKIVAAGEIRSTSNSNIIAIRLTTTGNLDTGFGTNGISTIDINGSSDYCSAMAIASNGGIYLGGYTINDDFYEDCALLKLNSAGKKDNSFSGDGIVVTDVAGFNDQISGIAIQADGKIVATGSTDDANFNNRFATLRYTSSGNLDSGFDQDGMTLTQLGNLSSEAKSVMIQSDGKIVCVGAARMSDNVWNVAVARYTASGALDPAFSGDGKVTTQNVGSESGKSFFILPDGSLLVWGSTGINGNNGALLKYTSTGNLDPRFGINGITEQKLYQTHSFVSDLAIQSDGKILAGGTTSGNFYNAMASVRLQANGQPDNSFNQDGIVESYLFVTNLDGKSLALQSDGKIIQQGIHKMESKNEEIILVRYLANGNLDENFGSNGKVTTDVGTSDDVGVCMSIQSDNKIIVAGYSYNGQNYDFMMTRYLSNGSQDNSFSADGKIIMPFGSTGNDGAQAIAVQKDGKILVGGFTEVNNETQFAIMRFTPQGNLDQTFNNTGKLSIDVSAEGNEAIKAIKIQQDGKIILAGDAFNGVNNDFALVRINPNGSLDKSFSGDGILMIDINNNYNEAADAEMLTDGKIIIGGNCIVNNYYEFALARVTSDGQLDPGFADRGIAILAIGPGNDILSSIALQSDGKLLLGGSSYIDYRVEFTVARVLTKLNVGVLDHEYEPFPLQYYPNPISTEINLEYDLTQEEEISISLMDLSGNEVDPLMINETRPQGHHVESLTLHKKIVDGPYILKVSTAKKSITVRLIKITQ